MLFLIEKNMWLLLLTLIFAGVAGWAWQGLRARPKELTLQRERERLLREVMNSVVDGGASVMGLSAETDREVDTLRRRADLDAARIAEMERALEAARDRAEEASSRLAEAERGAVSQADQDELQNLREEIAALHAERARTVEIAPLAAPVAAPAEEDTGLRWRLRYFEQRVRYLESQTAAPAPQAIAPPVAEAPRVDERETLRLDWRARYAEARARHLEEALREAAAQQAVALEPAPTPLAEPAPEPDPEAENMLRWRMMYLEKRLGYLQQPEPKPIVEAAPEPAAELETDSEAERLKWRARYLESRLRKLQAELDARPEAIAAPEVVEPEPDVIEAIAELPPEPVPTPEPEPEPVVAEAPEVIEAIDDEEDDDEEFDDDEIEAAAPIVPAGTEERPPGLPAARGGAPDDFTLIDDISPMLQSTLNALGIYHFEQIAAWSPANVAWLDQYFRLRGRITREEWIEQAEDLAREGPAAARRALEDEYA